MLESDGATYCDRCGLLLSVGDYPFCPHGRPQSGVMIETDEIPGGQYFENYGPHPIRFDSHSERHAYMKEHGLSEKEKFCPTPGTDIDPAGIPNPAGYMDPQTLLNAAALICRNGVEKDFDPESVMRVTSRTLTREEAIDAARYAR